MCQNILNELFWYIVFNFNMFKEFRQNYISAFSFVKSVLNKITLLIISNINIF